MFHRAVLFHIRWKSCIVMTLSVSQYLTGNIDCQQYLRHNCNMSLMRGTGFFLVIYCLQWLQDMLPWSLYDKQTAFLLNIEPYWDFGFGYLATVALIKFLLTLQIYFLKENLYNNNKKYIFPLKCNILQMCSNIYSAELPSWILNIKIFR